MLRGGIISWQSQFLRNDRNQCIKASRVIGVIPTVLGNAQPLTRDSKATCTTFVMTKDMPDIGVISAFDESRHQLSNCRGTIDLPFCFSRIHKYVRLGLF